MRAITLLKTKKKVKFIWVHLYHRHYLHPKVDYQPLSGKRARTPPLKERRLYSSLRRKSSLSLCLQLIIKQVCNDLMPTLQGWGGSLLRRHFYFSSRTPRDLHDAPKHRMSRSHTNPEVFQKPDWDWDAMTYPVTSAVWLRKQFKEFWSKTKTASPTQELKSIMRVGHQTVSSEGYQNLDFFRLQFAKLWDIHLLFFSKWYRCFSYTKEYLTL